MGTFTYNNKSYEVDSRDFLINFNHWDENYAEGMAIGAKIIHSLTKEHWDIIYFIRNTFKETGKCPLVFEVSIKNGLNLQNLKRLFPSGYLRGACKLAGITYKEGYIGDNESQLVTENHNLLAAEKTYAVDVRGFLLNPNEWNEYYAACRAYDMKIPNGKLTDKHWQIIMFLRKYFNDNNDVPTVYETCEENHIDLEELERLFPDGYHRGAVKIAGLRVR
ncbi:MAG: TusE/DsrC/DsvC family sulfur relay protein [candidate division Zixibacteria bacterium]|nr:TusE/DsrC/DsvC family sulfur relay protein [candidate division Zixibacteria bacterium]